MSIEKKCADYAVDGCKWLLYKWEGEYGMTNGGRDGSIKEYRIKELRADLQELTEYRKTLK